MNLNLNEQLLRDTKDAHICIFIANLASWLRYNAAKEKPEDRNYYEGRYWSFNSIKDFVNYFDFWSVKNIRTIIKHCEQEGLILIGNFNRKKYDQTLWYTLTDKALEYFPKLKEIFCTVLPDVANGNAGSGKPIPENPTSSSNNIITTSVSDETNSSSAVSNQEIVDAYHEYLPQLTRIKVIDRDLSNKIKFMKKNWHKYQKEGKAFTLNLFIDFLKFIKSNHKWFLTPRVTDSGTTRKNSLRNLIADKNLARFANGEFSAN